MVRTLKFRTAKHLSHRFSLPMLPSVQLLQIAQFELGPGHHCHGPMLGEPGTNNWDDGHWMLVSWFLRARGIPAGLPRKPQSFRLASAEAISSPNWHRHQRSRRARIRKQVWKRRSLQVPATPLHLQGHHSRPSYREMRGQWPTPNRQPKWNKGNQWDYGQELWQTPARKPKPGPKKDPGNSYVGYDGKRIALPPSSSSSTASSVASTENIMLKGILQKVVNKQELTPDEQALLEVSPKDLNKRRK